MAFDPTYVFSTATTATVPSTATNTVTWYPQANLQGRGTQTAGTATQNPTIYYDWQTMQQLQMEWARQQRLYEEHVEYLRRTYGYRNPEELFKRPEPEKLETKALSAAQRERLREALPF